MVIREIQPDIIVCVATNLLLIEHQQKSVSCQFWETYSIASYGSGWRKDVVNECLEFGIIAGLFLSVVSKQVWMFALLGIQVDPPLVPVD